MLFKKATTDNADPRVYNNTAYLNDTQLIMRNDEMNETCDMHNYYMLYTTKKETWAGVNDCKGFLEMNVFCRPA